MMIDKRLLNAVPNAKRFVWLTVASKTLSLFCNTLIIFSISHILANKDYFFPLLLIAISLCAIVGLDFLSSLASYKASRDVKKQLRVSIYQKLLRLGTSYQEKNTTAKIIQLAVEGVETLETWFGSFLPQFYFSMIAAVFTFAVLAFLNLKTALSLLLCVPLIPISMAVVQGIAKRLLGKYWTQYASLADNFLENLQGLTTLQIYQADGFKAKQMTKEAENFRKVTMKVLSMQLNSIIIMDIVAYSGAALGCLMALSAYYNRSLSLENAFVCILLSADFFIPLRRLGSAFHTAMNGSTASKNIFELLDEKEDADGSKEVPNISNIVFSTHNLGYEFDRVVLKNCNIEIKEGECVAFVGKSGSGKSTVAKVLSGIYHSYTGSAKIGESEIKEIKRASLYKAVTYISHRDWIFRGSVKECLLEAKENAKDEELWNVLEKVQLSSFLKEGQGLETMIEEGGSNLSGGQKQRLSIARALLKDSYIYIFDEATSNIDIESENAIISLLQSLKGKKTIIIISHRKENCSIADKIYYFENGEVSK